VLSAPRRAAPRLRKAGIGIETVHSGGPGHISLPWAVSETLELIQIERSARRSKEFGDTHHDQHVVARLLCQPEPAVNLQPNIRG
jgi:hypothetical protein